MTELSVSILSADLANLAAETADSMVCGADMVHFDVMDGHFVPNITYGAPVLVIVANQVGYGNAMADSAMALENMFLQAADLGVSSCYINQFHWLAEDAAIVRALRAIGLGETETVCAGGVFGYSNQKLPPLKRFGNIITYVGQEKEKL